MSNNHYPNNYNDFYNNNNSSTQQPQQSYSHGQQQQQQEDAMSMNNRSNQQNYPMQEMSHNSQRDTYGIPYHNNDHNPNYQQEQFFYGGGQPRQQPQQQQPQQEQQQSYGHDQYYENYHAAGGNNDNGHNRQDQFDPTERYGQPLEQPQYYNGYEDNRNSVLPMTTQDRSTTQLNRGGSGNNNNNAPGSLHGSGGGAYGGRPTSVQSGRKSKEAKPRSKYLPCFPCIRSTCGRVSCCILLLLLLLIIVLVIVVFTVFKMPTVDYLGLQGDPAFTFNQGNTTFGISLVANIQVQNPNPIGFNFERIAATAYYPGYAPSIGGGNITNVDFPSKSTKEIQFPIVASYNSALDPRFTVIQSILSKCGLLGGTGSQITINYDLKVTVKIIGISISPGIKNQSVNFACPSNIGQIANDIPGGIGHWLGGGK